MKKITLPDRPGGFLTQGETKELMESYAKEHAIEFMIYAQGLMFSPKNAPLINSIYTEWIDNKLKKPVSKE